MFWVRYEYLYVLWCTRESTLVLLVIRIPGQLPGYINILFVYITEHTLGKACYCCCWCVRCWNVCSFFMHGYLRICLGLWLSLLLRLFYAVHLSNSDRCGGWWCWCVSGWAAAVISAPAASASASATPVVYPFGTNYPFLSSASIQPNRPSYSLLRFRSRRHEAYLVTSC